MAVSATTVAGRPSLIRPATVTNNLVDSASGWRVWHVMPDDDPPTLRAPYGEAPPVTGRTVHAECSVHPHHQPPHPLARVHLNRVRWINRAVPWSDLKCTSPEMRAATARIECLYVADELIDHARARRLADQLSTALGVPAIVGYPGYTLGDWHHRPDWYCRGGPDGRLDDEYEPLVGGDQPHPPIPFSAPIPAPGETVPGRYVGRWGGQ